MYNRTIGERLKTEREALWLSLKEVSNTTKINEKYLKAIESNEFGTFHSHSQAKGFIKIYANYLKIDSASLIAIYRRDYEAAQKTRKTKLLTDEEFEKIKQRDIFNGLKSVQLTSKKLFIIAAFCLLIVFLGLGINFTQQAFSPPYFKVTAPIEITSGENKDFETKDKTITLSGETRGYVLIKINEVPLTLSSGFTFTSESIPITSESTKIIITGESQLGVKASSTITVFRKDIQESKYPNTAELTVEKDGVFVKVTVDGIIQYSDIADPKRKVDIKFNKNFIVDTPNPDNISLKYREQIMHLTKNSMSFNLGDNGELSSN